MVVVLIICHICWFGQFLPATHSSQIGYHDNKESFISNFTDTNLEKVTKFKFNCFSRLGVAFIHFLLQIAQKGIFTSSF